MTVLFFFLPMTDMSLLCGSDRADSVYLFPVYSSSKEFRVSDPLNRELSKPTYRWDIAKCDSKPNPVPQHRCLSVIKVL